MTEPLIENTQQTIPINSSEQVYSENNAPYTESHQNQSQNQPYVPSNELSPMYKENPDKTNSLPITPEVSYGFSFIFAIYLLQSLIYIGIFFFGKYNPKIFTGENFNWFYGCYFISCLVLFVSIRKYNENYGNSKCVMPLFALFFIFKIFFFILLFNSFMGSASKQTNIDNEAILLSILLFFNCTGGAIYLALIIYSLIKKEISLLISFGVGFLITLISFGALFFFVGFEFATFVAILVLIEIIFLFVSILISQKTDILEEDRPIHNILMIDYYKFFIIMLISYLSFMLVLLMLYCACCIAGCCSSKATYTDSRGNVFDQYGKSMGIKLSRRPAYVDNNGIFYDKNHNEISQDSGCQIF